MFVFGSEAWFLKAKRFVNLIFLPADQPIKKDRLTSLLFWIVSGVGFRVLEPKQGVIRSSRPFWHLLGVCFWVFESQGLR